MIEETMKKFGISDFLKKPLKNIFDSKELDEKSVCREFRQPTKTVLKQAEIIANELI